MKNRKKWIGTLLCIMLAVGLLPVNAYGAGTAGSTDYEAQDGIQYQLNSTAPTAVVIKAPADATTVTVPAKIQYDDGTFYQVTEIQYDAVKDCANLKDLIFESMTAPSIIGDSGSESLQLSSDATIYIKEGATGYDTEGWQVASSMQHYKITRQPIDIFILEGWEELGDIHQIAVEAEYPAADDELLTYQWYSCSDRDKNNAKLADGENSQNYYQLPGNLTAGTYYYFCRIGAAGEKQLDSNVVSVTVAAEPDESQESTPEKKPNKSQENTSEESSSDSSESYSRPEVYSLGEIYGDIQVKKEGGGVKATVIRGDGNEIATIVHPYISAPTRNVTPAAGVYAFDLTLVDAYNDYSFVTLKEGPVPVTFFVPGVEWNSQVIVRQWIGNQYVDVPVEVGTGYVKATFSTLSVSTVAIIVGQDGSAVEISGTAGTGRVSPKTGESSMIYAMGAAALLSLAGMIVCEKKRRA